jgi:hypothetical protein
MDIETLREILSHYKDFSEVIREYNKLHLNVKCIKCHQDAIKNAHSYEGIKEVTISGYCEKCFDELFDD